VRIGSRKRPNSSINNAPLSDRLSPTIAMEKMPSRGRPACTSRLFTMRKAGAPIKVMVEPSEAAEESGMSSFDGGMPRSRARSGVTGSGMPAQLPSGRRKGERSKPFALSSKQILFHPEITPHDNGAA